MPVIVYKEGCSTWLLFMLFHVYKGSLLLFVLSFVFFLSGFVVRFCGGCVLVDVYFIKLSGIRINMPFLFDEISLMLGALVCFISRNVIIFTAVYMSSEQFMKRFIHLILIFVGTIILFIFIPSNFFFLIGWDGLGVVSFVLVIYYQNNLALGGGIMTCLSNRLGDLFLIVSMFLLSFSGGWSVWSVRVFNGFNFFFLIFIVLGAFTKRAQMPFRAWLPIAIAAPTPISALVHSSTLVTAGVYLLVRYRFLLRGCLLLVDFVLVVSSITIFIARLSAIKHWDCKKIIALSTLSHLRFIIYCVAINFPGLAFFHLCVHAMFKSLIFMCVGILIHSYQTQDLRKIRGVILRLPFVRFVLVRSEFSMIGFPFLSGFYSKDLVMEGVVQNPFNIVPHCLVIFRVLCTSWYCSRLIFLFIKFKVQSVVLLQYFEKSIFYFIPLIRMLLLIVLGASLFQGIVVDLTFVFNVSKEVKLLPIVCIIVGVYYRFYSLNFRFYFNHFILSM
jgi:NADH-ubiquinone oxidoreductase chain 5